MPTSKSKQKTMCKGPWAKDSFGHVCRAGNVRPGVSGRPDGRRREVESWYVDCAAVIWRSVYTMAELAINRKNTGSLHRLVTFAVSHQESYAVLSCVLADTPGSWLPVAFKIYSRSKFWDKSAQYTAAEAKYTHTQQYIGRRLMDPFSSADAF